MRRIVVLLLCLLPVMLSLAGCGGSNGITVRYDISGPIQNLDPQFASDPDARMIISNVFEGLVVQSADGTILPGVAERYTVSENGLVYTFHLRENAAWSDGAPLTSADFEFAFRRLFTSASPYAADFICIKGAQPLLLGTGSYSQLGIETPDDSTIIFTLEYATPHFLELMASTPAMPCNEAFFQGTRGRYGLGPKEINENGPFTVQTWNNERYILLRKNAHYASDTPVLAEGVNLYIGRDNPLKLLWGKDADLAVISHSEISQLPSGATTQSFDKTTWCLAFNQRDPIVRSALLRQSLAHAVDYQWLGAQLPDNYTAAQVFIPPAIQLAGTSYRELAGSAAVLEYNAQRAKQLYSMALDSLELYTLPKITILIPEEGVHGLNLGYLQQCWLENLGIFVDLEAVPSAQLTSRFSSGNYQIALYPFSPSRGDVHSLLDAFTSSSPQNYTGYSNPRYDALLLDAVDDGTVGELVEKYSQAEAILLSDAVLLPVYFETTTYAVAKGITGIDIAPYAGRIHFKEAQKG